MKAITTFSSLAALALCAGGITAGAAAAQPTDRAVETVNVSAFTRGFTFTSGDAANNISVKEIPNDRFSYIDTAAQAVGTLPTGCSRNNAYTGPGLEIICPTPSVLTPDNPMNLRIESAGGNDRVSLVRGPIDDPNSHLDSTYLVKTYLATGDDTFMGGQGGDVTYGGGGNDTLDGNDGFDRFFGGAGADILYGRQGDDTLQGQGGPDRIYGGLWKDVIVGGLGNDRQFGEQGWDWIYSIPGTDFISGGTEGDKASISRDDTLRSIEKVYYKDSDVPPRPDPTPEIRQWLSITTFTGQTTPDGMKRRGYYLDSGQQNADQHVWVDTATNRLRIEDRTATVLDGTLPTACKRLSASYISLSCAIPADATYANPMTVKTFTRLGNDRVDLSLAPANVALWGLADRGADTFIGGAGRDFVNSAQENDRVEGRGGADWLVGNALDDIVLGGDGNDHVVGADGVDTVDGQAGNDDVYGSPGNDTLLGGTGDDRMLGETGNDSLTGGDGKDELRGSYGDDVLRADGDQISDTLLCGANTDTVYVDVALDSWPKNPSGLEYCERVNP